MSEREEAAQELQEPRSLVIPAIVTLLGILGMLTVALDTSRNFTTDNLFIGLWLVTVVFASWLVVQYTRRKTPKGELTRPKHILGIGAQVLVLCIALAILGPLLPVVGRIANVIYLTFVPSVLVLAVWFIIALIRSKSRKGSEQESS